MTVLQQPLQYLCSTDAGEMHEGEFFYYSCSLKVWVRGITGSISMPLTGHWYVICTTGQSRSCWEVWRSDAEVSPRMMGWGVGVAGVCLWGLSWVLLSTNAFWALIFEKAVYCLCCRYCACALLRILCMCVCVCNTFYRCRGRTQYLWTPAECILIWLGVFFFILSTLCMYSMYVIRYRWAWNMCLKVTCVLMFLHTTHTLSTYQSGPCIERQPTAVTQVAPSSRSSSSSTSPLNPPPSALRPPTFPNVSVRRALELSGAQQEASPVMWVALATGGGAEAPGGRATLVPEDLIDGRAVLIGQGRRIGRCITILLGVWGVGGGGGRKDSGGN